MTKTNDAKAAVTGKKKHKDKRSFKSWLASAVMCGPITIWTVLFIILPIILLAVMSFMTKGPL